jgi:hypothetical protein
MRRWVQTIAIVAATGCGKGVDQRKAATLYTEVPLATKPGLSGLAVDDGGGIWAIAERGGPAMPGSGVLTHGPETEAYRVTLDAALETTVTPVAVRGVPADTDLEAIAWLGPGKLAFGTEGAIEGIATVLTAEQKAGEIDITGAIVLDGETLGMSIKANQGAEGLCGSGDTIVAAIEGAAMKDGKRWAPVARIEHGVVARVYKVWLLTNTGKLSSLDCRVGADGTVTGWAIERHFEVTRIERFTLPPVGQGSDNVHPVEVLDLGPVLNSKLNLEGIAELADGRVVAVVDNQWKELTGPSELLVFKPGVLNVPPPPVQR